MGPDRRRTVDACEIKREGISYTIDTLRDISARYPGDGKPALILGDDLSADFPYWKNADHIAKIAKLIIARREQSGAAFPYPHKTLNNELCAISSAQVRALIRCGGAWQHLVPEGPRRIIQERRLYGAAPNPAAPKNPASACGAASLAYIEESVRTSLNVHRFLHSRNVALHSSDLALRFKLDGQSAYLAGITHDIAKELPLPDMIALAQKDGLPFSPLEVEKPFMLHGRAAAIILGERFGVKDPAIVEAVRFHTSGAPRLGPLGKIVYLADKIEAGRTHVDPKLRRLAFGPHALRNLDKLFERVKKATDEYLKNTLKT
jgi:nicotinate-nucleotide adenylyltransferase